MEALTHRIFYHNWQQKIVAILTAIIIWFFVSHSITETKTIRNVPIRISSLPPEKTIVGLLPNGILQKRINLTLSGPKDVIEAIEPGDVEVSIDASAIDHADWIVQINKKNLVSLNPNIDLANNITSVSYTEFVIKLNRLVVAKIAIDVLPPIGEPPVGYEFLDIWPQRLIQTVSGPEEEINRLKAKNLKLVFDLNEISKSDLDAIRNPQNNGNNEISFPIPNRWKQVIIPFHNDAPEEINDPEAQNLRIDFLRLEFLPIEGQIPIRIFFPEKTLEFLNPEKITFAESDKTFKKDGVNFFAFPLYVKNVSRLFLDIVSNYLEIVIVASAKNEKALLSWSLEGINLRELEDAYVAYKGNHQNLKQTASPMPKKREMLYRKRFREYFQKLVFYISPNHKLNIESFIEEDKVVIMDY